jgi:hypothetical protein
MRRIVVGIGLVVAIGGLALWGQTDPRQRSGGSENQKAYSAAYEKSYRAAFRSKSIEQCVATASNATAAGYDPTPTCTCATDALLATKTVQELTDLSGDRSSAALQAVTAPCLKSHPPVRASE